MSDDDPLRQEYRRRAARSQAMTARVLGIPDEPPPVQRPDGTVYDGTGEKPSARDVVEQVKAAEQEPQQSE